MACCGQKREALAPARPPARIAHPHREDQRRSPPAASSASQTLRLVNGERIVVHGPRTGWKYEFTPERPEQAVAAADAEWLVATGLFRRA